jgi:RNA polymerase sigma-B factor
VDPLTQIDDRLLFARLRASGSSACRDEATRRYLPLARRLARRYRYTGEPIDDLEQVACIGLLHAIDRFDPTRGAAFSSFAVPTILGEIRRHFRDRTWALRVPRQLQDLSWRLERTRDELTVVISRPPTVAELAAHLEVGEELILQALELATGQYAVPLDSPRRGDDTGEVVEEEWLGKLDDGFERAEDRAVLAPLLATLSSRDAQIVVLRFCGDLTQELIAERMGVSQMHVSRVLRRSIAKLCDAAADAA